MFALAADGKTNRKGMPSPLRLAVVANHHFDVVRLPVVPHILQKLALVPGALLGRAVGYAPTYEAAPARRHSPDAGRLPGMSRGDTAPGDVETLAERPTHHVASPRCPRRAHTRTAARARRRYRVADVEIALAALELTVSQLSDRARGDDASGSRRTERAATRTSTTAASAHGASRSRRPSVFSASSAIAPTEARDTHRRLEEAEAEAARHREAAERGATAARAPRRTRSASWRSSSTSTSAEPETRREGKLFDTAIELDAGPFGDLGSLTAFEQALAALPGVSEVYIRGFEAGRATIDLSLHAPAPLLEEMTERLPYVLDVASQGTGQSR